MSTRVVTSPSELGTAPFSLLLCIQLRNARLYVLLACDSAARLASYWAGYCCGVGMPLTHRYHADTAAANDARIYMYMYV